MKDFRLETFIQVCESGSFTKAAVELDVTQPAVSLNIAELEKTYGVRLFVRSRDRLEITPEGKIFLRYARRIMDDYSALDTAFSKEQCVGGDLKVFFSPSLREILSQDVLSVINVLRPDLNVEAVDDMGKANVCIIGETDTKRKDCGIMINVSVFPKNHPLAGLVTQAIELSRYE